LTVIQLTLLFVDAVEYFDEKIRSVIAALLENIHEIGFFLRKIERQNPVTLISWCLKANG